MNKQLVDSEEEIAQANFLNDVIGEAADNNLPLIFISHKHSDAKTADIVRRWIESETGNNAVRVVCSSDGRGSLAKEGSKLANAIVTAMAQCSLVLLLYTDPDANWDYCMWECGLSTEPKPENFSRSVVVFRFGNALPSPYQTALYTDVSMEKSIQQFAIGFLTKSGYVPSTVNSLTRLSEEQAEAKGSLLYTELKPFVRALDPEYPWVGITLQICATSAERRVAVDTNQMQSLIENFSQIIEPSSTDKGQFPIVIREGLSFVDFKSQIMSDRMGSPWGAQCVASMMHQVGCYLRNEPIGLQTSRMSGIFPVVTKVTNKGDSDIRFRFEFIRADGVVEINKGLNENGFQHMRMRVNTMRKIFSSLEVMLEKNTSSLFYMLGEKIASDLKIHELRDMIINRYATSYGAGISNIDLVKEWLRLDEEAGWGVFECNVDEEGVGTLKVKPTFSEPDETSDSCAFFEGYFSYRFSRIFGCEYKVKHETCMLNNSFGACQYVVTKSE